MASKIRNSTHMAALAGLLLCLGVAYLLFHSLAGGTLLVPGAYDSYTLQASNWLAGRNYIAGGENYPWLELAIYNGRYYQSFPPVPGVFMVPWVLVFGLDVPANLVVALYGLLTAAGIYACFWRRGYPPACCTFFAVFATMGSNFFWISTSGGVWFVAQVLGFCLCIWGIFFALGGGLVLPSLLFGLAVGCRPFYALLAAVWLGGALLRVLGGALPRRAAAKALLPISTAAAAMFWYNGSRFGSFLEFGHNYLPEFVNAESGQFSLNYLFENLRNLLRPVTLDSALQLHFPTFNGFLIFVANPLFAWWLVCALAVVWRRAKGRRFSPVVPVASATSEAPTAENRVAAVWPFPKSDWVLLGCCLLVLVATCIHRTLGGWQFGARYLVDLQIWPLLWFLRGGNAPAAPQGADDPIARPGPAALTLCGLAVLFNLYGAVYMLTH